MAGQQAADADALWFNPPGDRESGRRALTRERVVAEALAIIAADGAQALRTRDPLSPTSLDLAEAFLAPRLAAGLPGREAALAFRLIYDYTLGFALADPHRPPNSACGTRQSESSCTRSSAPCPLAASGPGRVRRSRLGQQPRPELHRGP